MKVLFLGTPEFAVKSLEALLDSEHTVVGVVTQPDRALKHGKTETSAVKKLAAERGITVFQPVKIRECIRELREFGADIAVTAAYGQILDAAVLESFPRGVINVHASLLPKYRGASPIQSAIAAGERETGVTIMRTELGLDTGDILATVKTDIVRGENAGELSARLSVLGAKLLVDTLDNLDNITPVKQNDALATHCRTISKSEQFLDFDNDAAAVVDKILSLSPSPCAKTIINGESYKIYGAKVCDEFDEKSGFAVGEIICTSDRLIIACATGCIEVLVIQAPSKRALPIKEFVRGKRFGAGVICAKP